MTSQNELLFRIPFGAHDEISQHMASMWVRLKVALGCVCDIAVLIMSKRKASAKGPTHSWPHYLRNCTSVVK